MKEKTLQMIAVGMLAAAAIIISLAAIRPESHPGNLRLQNVQPKVKILPAPNYITVGINTPQPNTKSTFGHWIDNGCCMVVCFCRQSRPSGDIEGTIKNWSPRQVRAANDYWQKVFEVF